MQESPRREALRSHRAPSSANPAVRRAVGPRIVPIGNRGERWDLFQTHRSHSAPRQPLRSGRRRPRLRPRHRQPPDPGRQRHRPLAGWRPGHPGHGRRQHHREAHPV